MNFEMFGKSHGLASKSGAGFTIIELVIVFAVSAVIFGVVVSGYPSFSNKAELENIALDIALTIREAQVYGVGVKETSVGTGEFDLAYGVYFDVDNPTQFVLFSDIDNDQMYDVGEGINTFLIKTNFRINLLCEDIACGVSTQRLDITFKRPDLDAVIISNEVPVPLSVAGVRITSDKTGDVKIIRVTNTGQISVQ